MASPLSSSSFDANVTPPAGWPDSELLKNRSIVKLLPYCCIPPWTVWSAEALKELETLVGSAEETSSSRFHDPANSLIPKSLEPVTWVLPENIFAQSPKIVDPDVEHIDLINPNVHLFLSSCVMRRIISEISELYDLRQGDPFFCASDDQVLGTYYHPWRPWNHIYSFPYPERHKANIPETNKSGRYAVRLFYMGQWRLILVDDTIPVLSSGLFALPFTNTFEFWPMLLTKALLKIAVLVLREDFNEEFPESKFSAIPYLTGWIMDRETYSANEVLSPNYLWDYLEQTLPRYRMENSQKEPEFPTDALFPCEALPGRTQSKAKKPSKEKTRGKNKNNKAKKANSKSKSKSPASGTDNSENDNSGNESGSQPSSTSPKKKRKKGNKGSSKSSKKSKGSSKKSGKKGKKKKETIGSEKVSETSETESCMSDFVDVIRSRDSKQQRICRPEDLPPLDEIMGKVQGFIGIQKQQLVRDITHKVERDNPVSLTAFLETFQVTMGQGDSPSPLHPVLLKQIRDRPLESTDPCRPPTPLWKTFRWKSWALEKGLLTHQNTLSQEDEANPRKVLIKTPILLKQDWQTPLPETGINEDNLEDALSMLRIPNSATMQDLPEFLQHALNSTEKKPKSPKKLDKSKKTKKKGKSKEKKLKRKKGKSKKTTSTAVSTETESTGGETDDSATTGHESTKSKIGQTSANSEMSTVTSGTESDGASKSGKSQKSKKSKKGKKKKAGSEMKRESVKDTPLKIPQDATGESWADIQDLSGNTRELIKYYTGQRSMGSSYVLIKYPLNNVQLKEKTKSLEMDFAELASILPTLPDVVSTANKPMPIADVVTVSEDRLEEVLLPVNGKLLRTGDLRMEDFSNPESGFYIYSDSWTEQSLLFTLDAFQDYDIYFLGKQLHIDDSLEIPQRLYHPCVTAIVKQWDWRNEESLDGEAYILSPEHGKCLRIKLPPGRHLYRIWLLEQPCWEPHPHSDPSNAEYEGKGNDVQLNSSEKYAHTALRILSSTPIYVGDRKTAQDLMTLTPATLLHQCDKLARSLWALLLSFGKIKLMNSSVKMLRKSYLPPIPVDRIKKPTGIHEVFDIFLLDVLQAANGGPLDSWTMLALRSLLLNPNLGKQEKATAAVSQDGASSFRTSLANDESPRISVGRCSAASERNSFISATYTQTAATADVVANCLHFRNVAATEIQRHVRGWLTRRLLKARRKTNRHFEKLELGVRKIAYLLAGSMGEHVLEERKLDKLLFPVPPLWAINGMELLFSKYPKIVGNYPHYSSLPNYLKIFDVNGKVPVFHDDLTRWIPFYRARISPESIHEGSLLHFELKTNVKLGIFMQIIDNDTRKPVGMWADKLWVGKLARNKEGYTVICFRIPVHQCSHTPLPGEQYWKLRQLTPASQIEPISIDIKHFPVPKLELHRFSGYYFPNYEDCVCRFEMEFHGISETLSLHFRSSDANAVFLLRIWNQKTAELIFEQHFRSSVMVPAIVLRGSPSPMTNDGSFYEDMSGDDFGESDSLGAEKFVFSVFVVHNSWKLIPSEWEFISKEMKKEWKKALVFREEEEEFVKSLKADDKDNWDDFLAEPETFVTEGSFQRMEPSKCRKKRSLPEPAEDETVFYSPGTSDPLETYSSETTKKSSKGSSNLSSDLNELETASKLPRNSNKTGSMAKDEISELLLNTKSKLHSLGLDSQSVPRRTLSAILGLPTTRTGSGSTKTGATAGSSELLSKPSQADILVDDRVEKPGKTSQLIASEPNTSVTSENLTIHAGGPNSSHIGAPEKPHWVMEFLTDITPVFKSNMVIFLENLRSLKEAWRQKGRDDFISGLKARYRFLGKNLIPTVPNTAAPKVDLSDLKGFTCLHLDEDLIPGLSKLDGHFYKRDSGTGNTLENSKDVTNTEHGNTKESRSSAEKTNSSRASKKIRKSQSARNSGSTKSALPTESSLTGRNKESISDALELSKKLPDSGAEQLSTVVEVSNTSPNVSKLTSGGSAEALSNLSSPPLFKLSKRMSPRPSDDDDPGASNQEKEEPLGNDSGESMKPSKDPRQKKPEGPHCGPTADAQSSALATHRPPDPQVTHVLRGPELMKWLEEQLFVSSGTESRGSKCQRGCQSGTAKSQHTVEWKEEDCVPVYPHSGETKELQEKAVKDHKEAMFQLARAKEQNRKCHEDFMRMYLESVVDGSGEPPPVPEPRKESDELAETKKKKGSKEKKDSKEKKKKKKKKKEGSKDSEKSYKSEDGSSGSGKPSSAKSKKSKKSKKPKSRSSERSTDKKSKKKSKSPKSKA